MLATTTSETRIGVVLNGFDAALGYAALQSKELQTLVNAVEYRQTWKSSELARLSTY